MSSLYCFAFLWQVLSDVIGIVNNVITSSENQVQNPDVQEANAPHLQDILTTIEDQVTTFADTGMTFDPIVESNIVVTTTQLAENFTSSLSFAVFDTDKGDSGNKFTVDNVKVYEDAKDVAGNQIRSSITLPASIFNTTNNNGKPT